MQTSNFKLQISNLKFQITNTGWAAWAVGVEMRRGRALPTTACPILALAPGPWLTSCSSTAASWQGHDTAFCLEPCTWPKQKGPTPLYSPFLTAAATPNFSKTCSRHTFNSIGASESLKNHCPTNSGLMPPSLSWGPRKIDLFHSLWFFACKKNAWIFARLFFVFFGNFSDFRPLGCQF